MSLSGGAVWLAICGVADGKLGNELFRGMVRKSMSTPMIKKVFGRNKTLMKKAKQMKLKSMEISNKIMQQSFGGEA